MHHVCAVELALKWLTRAVLETGMRHREGWYEEEELLGTLYMLYGQIRAGICTQTRRLNTMPPLLPLLNRLPAGMAAELEQAIESERRGRVDHSRTMLTQAGLNAWVEGRLRQIRSGPPEQQDRPSGPLPALGG